MKNIFKQRWSELESVKYIKSVSLMSTKDKENNINQRTLTTGFLDKYYL